jgi:cephalosporin hydroxylase
MNKALKLLRYRLYHRLYISPQTEQDVIDRFHRLYYDAGQFGKTLKSTFWLGVPTAKCPLDLWVYQEILFELRPDVIIETGTARGGSALFLASMCDLIGNGRIITIDIQRPATLPTHARIQYLHGSSVAPPIVQSVRAQVGASDRVMVILDSDHSHSHVLQELRTYAPLVTRGSYLVVEDTDVNGHPVYPDHGPGPTEAIQEFLQESREFVIDREKEKFLMTLNPQGYLRRVP